MAAAKKKDAGKSGTKKGSRKKGEKKKGAEDEVAKKKRGKGEGAKQRKSAKSEGAEKKGAKAEGAKKTKKGAEAEGAEKYTEPQLRQELKQRIERGDEGGRSGQWSARKAQLLVQEYEKQGGGYVDDRKDEAQQHLSEWSDQDWQTREGGARARTDDGEVQRYLPVEAWEELPADEARATDARKRRGSRSGQQHVANTPRAAAAGARARGRDYSAMTVAQALEALEGARRPTVQRALEQERAGKNRVTLVRRLEQRLA